MSLRSIQKALLVGGLVAMAAGAYTAWRADYSDEFAAVGIIALLALGVFSVATGALGLLGGQTPSGEWGLRAQILDRMAWKALLPPVAAGALMVAFFALTKRWERLDNPVASQIALAAGVFGLLIGILADRVTNWALIIIPVGLIIGLLAFGDRLLPDSETTPRGVMVGMLVFLLLVLTVAINVPQLARGRRVG